MDNDIIERLDRIEQVLALLLAAVVDEIRDDEIKGPASLDVDAPLPEGLYVLNSPDGSAPPF